MIKVLKGYDGINHGTIVEVIERKGRNFGDRRKGEVVRYEVSYKGKWHVVFNLPACFGEVAGSCISIKEV
jgi:hypothetical protein